MKAENILIIEKDNLPSDHQNFQRIITTVYRPDTDYFYDFWDPKEFRTVYEKIYAASGDFLLAMSEEGRSLYRGIELFRCFRHDFFLFMLSAEISNLAFQSLRKKYPNAIIHIDTHAPDFLIPFLSQILSERSVGEVVFRKPKESPTAQKKPWCFGDWKQLFWPSRISTALFLGARTAVYADYYRSSEVMKRLPFQGRMYFTTAKEPKTFLQALINFFSYDQAVYSCHDTARYEKKAATYHLSPETVLQGAGNLEAISHLWPALARKMDQIFTDELPPLLFQIDRAYRLFEKHPHLKGILLDEDISPFKNTFCQIARIKNRKTYVECHGAVTAKHGFVPVTADHVFVWGARQKDKLIEWGCPASKIIISGCSKYGKYERISDRIARRRICELFKLNPSQRIVLFTPFPLEYSSRYFLAKVIRARIESILKVLSTHSTQLIIKLHPCETNKEFYRTWMQGQSRGSRVVLIEKFDPLLLAKACDFSVVHDSTMAIDAFALGKNVIFFPVFPPCFGIANSISNFEGYRVFYAPSSLQEFLDIYEQLLRDPFTKPAEARWEEARRECLSETGQLPEETIASYLVGDRKVECHNLKG